MPNLRQGKPAPRQRAEQRFGLFLVCWSTRLMHSGLQRGRRPACREDREVVLRVRVAFGVLRS